MKAIVNYNEVFLDGDFKSFEFRYKGAFRVTEKDDNLILSSNDNKVIGFSANGSSLKGRLFKFEGTVRILKFYVVDSFKKTGITLNYEGLDYWKNIGASVNFITGAENLNWDTINTSFSDLNRTYKSNAIKIKKKGSVAVNNNQKTKYHGQLVYKNGEPVAKDVYYHIHSNGTMMTGATHDDVLSERIYYKIDKKKYSRANRLVNIIRTATRVKERGY